MQSILTQQLAKHLKEVYFGGNWTTVNLRDTLADITWQQATATGHGLNKIAALTFHVHYYIKAVSKVLQGAPLIAKDALSFDHPPIVSDAGWQELQTSMWADAAQLADLIERMPGERLWEPFTDEKYGIYYRNLMGIIEHLHYHLGQMVLIKKLLLPQPIATA